MLEKVVRGVEDGLVIVQRRILVAGVETEQRGEVAMTWLGLVEVLRPFEESSCSWADRWAMELRKKRLSICHSVLRAYRIAQLDEAGEEVPKQGSVLGKS